MQKPRIAIPEIGQNVSNYANAVRAGGMNPVIISVQKEHIHRSFQQEYLDYTGFQASSYDGLVIPGGWDICPCRYGQKDVGCLKTDEGVDDLQFTILDDFIKINKPVLGICRGHQLINVYYGGTLIQDLPTKNIHAWSDAGDRVHRSLAKEGSWIAELYGTEFAHNSSHHQAIDLCGEDIEIVSRCCDDGVVEAIRHRTKEIYGVQWHPERMCLAHARPDTVSGLPVFQFFCRICGGAPPAPEEYEDPQVHEGSMI